MKPDSDEVSRLPQQILELLFAKDRLGCKAKFIRGLIHNVNGPLQNVSVLTELLQAGLERVDAFVSDRCEEDLEEWNRLADNQRHRLDQLSDQIGSLIDMLRDFIVFNEMEASPLTLDLNFLLTKLIQIYRADLFFKHWVKVEMNLAPSLPPIAIPGRHLIPALMHLFENAVCAVQGRDLKVLTFETAAEGDRVLLLVKDTGCGMVSEAEPFELFHSHWPPQPSQVEPHELREAHFGFGLFAVRSLLEPYGATIALERKDQGTVAVLNLPVNRQ